MTLPSPVLAAAPPADAVRRAADGVFARPEFRDEPGESGGAEWLLRGLRTFFKWLGGLHETAPALFWVVLVGCVVLLVVMLVLIVYQVRSAFGGGDGRRRRESADEAVRRQLSAGFREEADRRAGAGDYTEAVRNLFLALVYRYDERGQINFRTAYTNREYLTLVGDRLPVRDALRLLVDTLDDHWYGQRAVDRPRYDECRAVYDRLTAAY